MFEDDAFYSFRVGNLDLYYSFSENGSHRVKMRDEEEEEEAGGMECSLRNSYLSCTSLMYFVGVGYQHQHVTGRFGSPVARSRSSRCIATCGSMYHSHLRKTCTEILHSAVQYVVLGLPAYSRQTDRNAVPTMRTILSLTD
jgi:hypothetical protein